MGFTVLKASMKMTSKFGANLGLKSRDWFWRTRVNRYSRFRMSHRFTTTKSCSRRTKWCSSSAPAATMRCSLRSGVWSKWSAHFWPKLKSRSKHTNYEWFSTLLASCSTKCRQTWIKDSWPTTSSFLIWRSIDWLMMLFRQLLTFSDCQPNHKRSK